MNTHRPSPANTHDRHDGTIHTAPPFDTCTNPYIHRTRPSACPLAMAMVMAMVWFTKHGTVTRPAMHGETEPPRDTIRATEPLRTASPHPGFQGSLKQPADPVSGNTARKSRFTRNAFRNFAHSPLCMGHKWQQTARKKTAWCACGRKGKETPPARSGGKRQKKARVAEPFKVLCEKHTGRSRPISGKKY